MYSLIRIQVAFYRDKYRDMHEACQSDFGQSSECENEYRKSCHILLINYIRIASKGTKKKLYHSLIVMSKMAFAERNAVKNVISFCKCL